MGRRIRNNSFQVHSNPSGFALTGAMVGFGLLGTLAMGFATLVHGQNAQIQGLRLSMSRDSIKSLADRFAADMNTIQTSLDSSKFADSTSLGNQLLNFCLNGPPAGATSCPTGSTGTFPNCCIATSGGAPVFTDFYLADPGDPSPTSKRRLAGILQPSSDPVRYDIYGSPCSSASTQCILQLSTSFVAQCPGGAAACSQASLVSVRYTLGQASGFNPPAGIPLRTIISNPTAVPTGTAPTAQARAWAIFNGGYHAPCSPDCMIYSSYNVLRVRRMAQGQYTVTFATAMPDANYAVTFGGPGIVWGGAYNSPLVVGHDNSNTTSTPNSFNIRANLSQSGSANAGPISFAVYR